LLGCSRCFLSDRELLPRDSAGVVDDCDCAAAGGGLGGAGVADETRSEWVSKCWACAGAEDEEWSP
jgi:hypothetical protein